MQRATKDLKYGDLKTTLRNIKAVAIRLKQRKDLGLRRLNRKASWVYKGRTPNAYGKASLCS